MSEEMLEILDKRKMWIYRSSTDIFIRNQIGYEKKTRFL